MRTKPIHYLQYDTRWGYITFSSHGDPKQTIATSGCGAASFAMVLATFIDLKITPPDVATVIVDNFYRTHNNGVDWGFFDFAAKKYGLEFKQTNLTNDAIEALKKGALVVASMGPGYFTKTGHYVLLWGLDESAGQILVNDPNSEMRTKASCDIFRQQSLNYFIFYEPTKEEETVPEDWEIKVMQEAENAGLIQKDYHKPGEPATKAFVLAVALKIQRQLEDTSEMKSTLRNIAGATSKYMIK